MKNLSPLEQAVQAFAQWRQQRANSNSRTQTPDELRQQAVNLLGAYKENEITTALNVRIEKFKKWCQDFSSGEQEKDFIPLSIPVAEPAQISIPQSTLEFELTLPNASQLRIRGELSAELLRVLLQEAKTQ